MTFAGYCLYRFDNFEVKRRPYKERRGQDYLRRLQAWKCWQTCGLWARQIFTSTKLFGGNCFHNLLVYVLCLVYCLANVLLTVVDKLKCRLVVWPFCVVLAKSRDEYIWRLISWKGKAGVSQTFTHQKVGESSRIETSFANLFANYCRGSLTLQRDELAACLFWLKAPLVLELLQRLPRTSTEVRRLPKNAKNSSFSTTDLPTVDTSLPF